MTLISILNAFTTLKAKIEEHKADASAESAKKANALKNHIPYQPLMLERTELGSEKYNQVTEKDERHDDNYTYKFVPSNLLKTSSRNSFSRVDIL